MAIIFHSIKPKLDLMGFTLIGYNAINSEELAAYDLQTKGKNKAKKLLNRIEDMFSEYNIPVETRLVENKNPEDFIKEIIKREKIELIILSCKGHHSKLRRFFFETLPQKILNFASVDLLVVR
jgi:nucleotide-binding universal stress UspA family protein